MFQSLESIAFLSFWEWILGTFKWNEKEGDMCRIQISLEASRRYQDFNVDRWAKLNFYNLFDLYGISALIFVAWLFTFG